MANRALIWLTTNKGTTWFIRNIASKLDPVLFKLTNGHLTTFGPVGDSMLTMTTVGRHSGKPRSVQLASIPYGNDYLVVASAMGQEKHPAWRYNIEAHPRVSIQVRGERFEADAGPLSDEEKSGVWDTVLQTIPQVNVYEQRTDRNIRVFRLRRVET